jgi:sugar phosphate isomerase/epimerase
MIWSGVVSRRDFLKSAAVGVAGSAIPGAGAGCAAGARIRDVPVGVQLYSVRRELADDLPGGFQRLAEIGFEGVEYADYFGYSAAELREIQDRHGLRCCGTHIHIPTLQGEALASTLAFNQTLGNEFLIIRSIPPERRTDRATFLRTIDDISRIQENVRPHGMRAGFHAHSYIFESFEGDHETLWDLLARNTPDDFVLQLDTGWAAAAREDPAEIIRRYPGRTASMHVKAYLPDDPGVLIGDDLIRWPEVFRAAEEEGGVEWYILEYEEEEPFEALERSLATLRRIIGR